MTLRRATITDLMDGIDMNELPKTVKEAVMVCRKLTLRYIRADALCIMQDDDDELATDISRMGSAYAGSLLSIAASDSKNGEDGCFRIRSPLKQPCRIWTDNKHVVYFSRIFLYDHEGHDAETEYALDYRAWIYQERLLSPRTIHFGRHRLV